MKSLIRLQLWFTVHPIFVPLNSSSYTNHSSSVAMHILGPTHSVQSINSHVFYLDICQFICLIVCFFCLVYGYHLQINLGVWNIHGLFVKVNNYKLNKLRDPEFLKRLNNFGILCLQGTQCWPKDSATLCTRMLLNTFSQKKVC